MAAARCWESDATGDELARLLESEQLQTCEREGSM